MGYFDDASMLRRVHREQVVGLAGPRALLLQAAHPVAFAGFFAHTGALDDPYGRLRRTGRVMDAVAFGTKREADRMTAPVRRAHARVRGALAESAMTVFPRAVRSLSREELNALWLDYREVGRAFGLRGDEMPADIDGF